MDEFKRILFNELILSLGCTEPVAIAYASSYAGSFFDYEDISNIDIYCSRSIIKNAYSVVVPNSNSQKGIKIACALGIVSKNNNDGLEVLRKIEPTEIEKANSLLDKINIHLEENVDLVYIRVEIKYKSNNKVVSIVEHEHNNLSYLSRNDEILVNKDYKVKDNEYDYNSLNVSKIYEYVNNLDLNENKDLFDLFTLAIENNLRIGEEGLKNPWGMETGKCILETYPNNTYKKAVAYAAAASDARMSGCNLPVMINSGSGNQGLTITLPIYIYGKDNGVDEEKIIKSLIFASLISIHQKQHIGKLSAFCGVVCAAGASICGIAYMQDLSLEQIEIIISNNLATSGGIICDGATPSCSLKIATALDCAFINLELAKSSHKLNYREGIVGKDIEDTIDRIGIIAHEKMIDVDNEVLKMMISDSKM